jgi:hypothetical protein
MLVNLVESSRPRIKPTTTLQPGVSKTRPHSPRTAKTFKLFPDSPYEPTGCLHRVSRNPSKEGKTRILAVVLHPADVKDIVIPEKDKK